MSNNDHDRRHPVLSCQDVNQFLADYLEGALEGRARARFERHLARCPQCQAYLDQYRTTIDLVRAAGQEGLPQPPEQLVEYTLTFLREHLGQEGSGR